MSSISAPVILARASYNSRYSKTPDEGGSFSITIVLHVDIRPTQLNMPEGSSSLKQNNEVRHDGLLTTESGDNEAVVGRVRSSSRRTRNIGRVVPNVS